MSALKRAKLDMDVNPELADKCINTIRCLAADVVQKANSGHPGAPMGIAPIAYLLWTQVLKYNPKNPKWLGRDRFVLSNGHACALQYVMLHLTGYPVSMDDLKSFRQIGSKTPGHPENHLTPGVEVSTGPLGQGISNAVGLALAERHLAAVFNKPEFPVFDNHTIVVCGDGCLQEGVSAEAGSMAGHLGLHKLIVLYDDNKITIDGETDLSFSEDVCKRYEAYGWHTITIDSGNSAADVGKIHAAIEEAKAQQHKPTLIKVRTTIGFGSTKQGTEKVHGSPLGADDIKHVKKLFGFNPDESFAVTPDVAAIFHAAGEAGAAQEAQWNAMMAAYQKQFPELAAELDRRAHGALPAGWEKHLPVFKAGDAAKATRQYSQMVLEKIVPVLPELIGGSADLTPSTLTKVKGNELDFQKETPAGRYLRYGVREHAMSSVCNGIAAYGCLIPFASTFLNFVGYALGAIRLSALSHFRVLYVMTHDSIGLGEDGPTHQPIETLASLRSMPNMVVIRPADGNETSGAYKVALEHAHTPTTLALSRQNCDNLEGTSIASVALGAYIIHEAAGAPQLILTGSGSEMQLAVKAAVALIKSGVNVRVVSFPSFELFEQQSIEYRASVFPAGVPVLAVEAASVFGWDRYSHGVVGMRSFGASAPLAAVMSHFGFTVDSVVDKAQKLLAFYHGKAAPDLVHRPQL